MLTRSESEHNKTGFIVQGIVSKLYYILVQSFDKIFLQIISEKPRSCPIAKLLNPRQSIMTSSTNELGDQNIIQHFQLHKLSRDNEWPSSIPARSCRKYVDSIVKRTLHQYGESEIQIKQAWRTYWISTFHIVYCLNVWILAFHRSEINNFRHSLHNYTELGFLSLVLSTSECLTCPKSCPNHLSIVSYFIDKSTARKNKCVTL